MKNCSLFYIKTNGLLFIQFAKSERSKPKRITNRFSEELADGTIISGKPVRSTKTGLVLDQWSVYHDPRSTV